MNETTAIRLCLEARDPRGFEYLVKQYRREAFYHAVGFVGDRCAAEDICQEAFARAYASMARARSLTAFYPWFYTILKNTCLNYLRGHRVHVELDELEDAASNPRFAVEGDDEKRSVWHALSTLKPEFREILIMKHLRDASYREISETLQIPRGTVMSRLYHARKAFAAAFESIEESADE